MTKTKESEYMAFRPGDLAAKVGGAAKRNGLSKSDIVRRALEMYLDLEPLQPLAIYRNAAAAFGALAIAAADLGLFSDDSLHDLLNALDKTRSQVDGKLEPLFRQLYPGEMTPDEFSATVRGKMRQRENLTDETVVGSDHVERYKAALESFGHFPDLQEAKRALRRQLRARFPERFSAHDPLEGLTFSSPDVQSERQSKKKKGRR